MKQVFLVGFIILLAGCTTSNKVGITGNITNSSNDKVIIENELTKVADTVSVVNGSFTYQKNIDKPGFYSFKNGDAGFRIFLEPGDNFTMDFNEENIKSGDISNILFYGEGYESSQFMLHLYDMRLKNSLRELLKQSSDSFSFIVSSGYKKILSSIDSFENTGNASPYFLERIKIVQKAQNANPYIYYVQYHKNLSPEDSTEIPASFYNVGDDIPLDNADYFEELTEYKYYVVRKYDYELNKQIKDKGFEEDSKEEAEFKIDFIAGLAVPQNIKDVLGKNILSSYTYVSDDAKEVYEKRYAEIMKNEEYVKSFQEEVQKMKALKPGSKAPVFVYQDIKGDSISLESLKGKVVYVDVWATWCGPCKGELPFLKKLEEELHQQNIAFVSVSIDQDKSAWEKMVHEKDLKGYQLFADNAWNSSIVKDYVIRGIPRFIMIDKNGAIVNVNASRPSEPSTKEQLLNLAKM